MSAADPSNLIIGCSVVGILWATLQFRSIAQTKLPDPNSSFDEERTGLKTGKTSSRKEIEVLNDTYNAITAGAEAFLRAEYTICAYFVIVFAAVIFFLISWGQNSTYGFFTTVSFLLGAITSIASGYIGMRVAVYSNVRTTINAQKGGFKDCFNTAFRAGAVMGFALTSLGILVLYITLLQYLNYFPESKDWVFMMDCISGYGLGGSTIAMFGRVGGGIYTKAADVGADLVGKVIHGIPEDDPRNPATIADNVGDNVGDVAGMGADLFGSFAESTCASLVIAAGAAGITDAGWGAVVFPLTISSVGIIVCLVSSFLATDLYPVTSESRIELALRLQLIVTTVLMIPATFWCASSFLPETFLIEGVANASVEGTRDHACYCVIGGLVGGLIIGLTTEYYTSKEYTPVRELVQSCKTGSATNIIYGLSLGYKSVIIPVFILAFIIYMSFSMLDLFGVALSAVGMLGNLATGLTIDAYGPVCDNAGGIAEMAELHKGVREKTDALDAAGNTTAAVGKGFAIGSAALVSLALFGAFVVRINVSSGGADSNLNILQPLTFSFLLIGSMIPYWFSAMTMKSVGKAAMEMVNEVKRQFDENPDLLNPHGKSRPDYDRCVQISTESSLKEMIAPGALVLLAPLITGTLFGVTAVYGLLTGSLLSSVQLAVSMSNTGGAWDNCKKYIESNVDPSLGGKGSDIHKAAVVGDTVGDPLKDTSGPALNIVMKLMAIMSLVFADYFYAINDGNGLFNMDSN